MGHDSTSPFSIAIVGGGAASVAFLHHFISLLPAERARPILITVLEERSNVGPGLAYQEDIPVVLLNRPAKTMSASGTDLATFRTWLEWKSVHFRSIADLMHEDLSQCYLPRPLFGVYLNEFFAETVAAAKRKNVFVESRQIRVTSIKKGERIHLSTACGTNCVADVTVLCVGNTPADDHYGLANSPNYIHSPYPVGKIMSTMHGRERVAILGTSLSAVDVALALADAGHKGPITMLSKDGELPAVRSTHYQPHTPIHLTPENVRACIAKNGGSLGWRDLLRLFRREMRAIREDWRKALRSNKATPARVQLAREILASDSAQGWQALLAATNTVVEDCWHHLSNRDKDMWMYKFHKTWMINRAPIPVVNALKLQQMLNTGQLRVMNGISSVHATDDGGFAIFRRGRRHSTNYNMVVNATGACRHITSSNHSPLLWQLIEEGYAVPHSYGGIDVEFETAAVVDANGIADRTIRAIGHVTSGVYYFTSSLEMISKKAFHVSQDIVKLISAHKAPKVLTETTAPWNTGYEYIKPLYDHNNPVTGSIKPPARTDRE